MITRLLSQLLIVQLCEHFFFVQCKTKQKQKNVCGFYNIFWRIFKILKKLLTKFKLNYKSEKKQAWDRKKSVVKQGKK